MATTKVSAPDCYRAEGRVVDAASREGIPGLIVTLYHTSDPGEPVGLVGADALNGTALRLGSVMTDVDGGFRIDYSAARTRGEGPNLIVAVAGPESEDVDGDPLLHVSRQPRRNAGPVESFSIAVARERLEALGLNDEPTVEARIASYRADWKAEEALADGITAFHKPAVESDRDDRETFRDHLLKMVATDLSVADFPGEMAAGDDIAEKVDTVAERSIKRANALIRDGRGVPVNLFLMREDRERLAPFFDDAVDGVAEIPESALQDILFRTTASENPGTLLIHQNPIARFCAEQTFEETCATDHTGLGPQGGDETDENGGDAETGEGTENENPTVALTNESVPLYAARLLDSAPSPDSVLSPALSGRRLDKEGLEAVVNAFALRVGPADVPAYYDFQTLQIAFDHVWKILIDEEMVDAAHSLDKRYKAKTGLSLAARFNGPWTDILSNGGLVYESIPREVPADVLAQFDITLPEWTDLNASYQAKLREIAKELDSNCPDKIKVKLPLGLGNVSVPISRLGTLACEKRRQDLREQGERIIDSVRHDDYYTLHRTLRELKRRIESGYEFTVFASNRSETAVNFGLLNTYRQEWAPINYQAGKLISPSPPRFCPTSRPTRSLKRWLNAS